MVMQLVFVGVVVLFMGMMFLLVFVDAPSEIRIPKFRRKMTDGKYRVVDGSGKTITSFDEFEDALDYLKKIKVETRNPDVVLKNGNGDKCNKVIY